MTDKIRMTEKTNIVIEKIRMTEFKTNICNLTETELISFVDGHLHVNTQCKKDFGEVFTCSTLINKMLDHLPSCVWKNPSLTWLEPSCGIGSFMVMVYLRLMKGLQEWCSDSMERSEHIIKNMLYMVELNMDNVVICKRLFSNVYCANFLEWNTSAKYNIILGNLPFQSKSCLGGKNKLYEKMMERCLDLYKDYVLVITPDNIFSGGSKLYKRLLENRMRMIDFSKSNQMFFPGIQQFICYFLVEGFGNIPMSNTPISNTPMSNTQIICNDGSCMEIVLKNRPVNPVRDWNVRTEQLIEKYVSNGKNNVIYNRGKSLQMYFTDPSMIKDSPNSFTLIYTPKQYLYTDRKELAIGIGIPKIVIFGISVKYEFREDFSGEYGVGPNTFYVPVRDLEHGTKIVAFLKSEEYKLMVMSTKTNRQFLKCSFLQHLCF